MVDISISANRLISINTNKAPLGFIMQDKDECTLIYKN